jgi:hypothetical protein
MLKNYLNVKPENPDSQIIFPFYILFPCVEFLPLVNVFPTSFTPVNK